MYGQDEQLIFLNRFVPTLAHMIKDGSESRQNYTIDEIINFYTTENILEGLELSPRYMYNIDISQVDLIGPASQEGNNEENNEENAETE